MREYFLHNGNEQKGPYDINSIKKQKITKNTMIWYDGLDDWIKAEKISELKEIIIVTPPPFNNKDIPSPRNIVSSIEKNIDTWQCKICHEVVDNAYDVCWNCGADINGQISVEDENKFKESKNDIESSGGSSLMATILITFIFSLIGFIVGYLIYGNIMGSMISIDKIFSSNRFSSLAFSNIREKIIIFTIIGGIIGFFLGIKKNKSTS